MGPTAEIMLTREWTSSSDVAACRATTLGHTARRGHDTENRGGWTYCMYIQYIQYTVCTVQDVWGTHTPTDHDVISRVVCVRMRVA